MRLGLTGIIIYAILSIFPRNFAALPNKPGSPSGHSLSNFYQSVADYFKVPQQEIHFVKGSIITDEEIPVVFFISKTASANIEEIVNMRLCGLTWADITKYYGLDLKMFIESTSQTGCKKHDIKDIPERKSKRKAVRKFNDKEIIKLINIKFISEDNLCSAMYIRKLHKEGVGFVDINQQVFLEHRTLLKELRNRTRQGENLAGANIID